MVRKTATRTKYSSGTAPRVKTRKKKPTIKKVTKRRTKKKSTWNFWR